MKRTTAVAAIVAIIMAITTITFGCSKVELKMDKRETSSTTAKQLAATSETKLLEQETSSNTTAQEVSAETSQSEEPIVSDDGTEKGTYNKAGFGDTYQKYVFETDDFVVYQLNAGTYLLGDDSGETGNSYGSVFIPGDDYKDLLTASKEWLVFVFLSGDFKAVRVAESHDEDGNIYHEMVEVSELSKEDRQGLSQLKEVHFYSPEGDAVIK